MTLPIEDVLRDDDLRVRFLKGISGRLVVVFTGIGAGFGGAQLDEFAASASGGGANDVLFVTDRRQSWYATPGLWDRIVRLVSDVTAVEKTTELVTLGNSMGGFGSMLATRDLPVRRAIAFSPQVSMDHGILRDTRWPDVAATFGPLPIRSTADLVGAVDAEFYVAAAKGCEADMAHLDLLPEHERLHRFVLPGRAHNVAGRLKAAGHLSNVITAIVLGRTKRVTTFFRRYSRELTT
ncbi:hypothetical protein ACK8OR_11790 [Jannaschia sp. KMU-145]|uniref:hypothetical protein n=1 Tax=Jannaschia halovivens TaxID=3388667 RepID=UPI00396B0E51